MEDKEIIKKLERIKEIKKEEDKNKEERWKLEKDLGIY